VLPGERIACVVLANRTDNGELVQDLADCLMRSALPGWTTPHTLVTARTEPYTGGPPYQGRWQGTVRDEAGVHPITLNFAPDHGAEATIGAAPSTRLLETSLRGGALVAALDCDGRTLRGLARGTCRLKLKLVPSETGLTGRLLATAESPGQLATTPFVVRLTRKPATAG